MKYTAFKIIFNLIYYLNIFIFRFHLCIWNTDSLSLIPAASIWKRSVCQ